MFTAVNPRLCKVGRFCMCILMSVFGSSSYYSDPSQKLPPGPILTKILHIPRPPPVSFVAHAASLTLGAGSPLTHRDHTLNPPMTWLPDKNQTACTRWRHQRVVLHAQLPVPPKRF
jgi:hypothetical protein